MKSGPECPFCNLPPARIWKQSDIGLAFADAYPLVPGHTLVIPRRHVQSLFELDGTEQAAVWQFVASVRGLLQGQLTPDAFNIGINDGLEAGQTIAHAHIHVIPRRNGDVADPRGGIRWIFPDRAAYWASGQ